MDVKVKILKNGSVKNKGTGEMVKGRGGLVICWI